MKTKYRSSNQTLRSSRKPALALFACAAVLGAGGAQAALTVVTGADEPSDSFLSHIGGSQNNWRINDGGNADRNIAQSFTVGATTSGEPAWGLETITVHKATTYTVPSDPQFILAIHEIGDPQTPDFGSQLYRQTTSLPASVENDHYVTFDLGEVVILNPGSSYVFTLELQGDETSIVGLYHTFGGSDGGYGGGSRFVNSGTGWETEATPHDANFWLGGQAVPEPGSLLLALGALGVFGAQRRR